MAATHCEKRIRRVLLIVDLIAPIRRHVTPREILDLLQGQDGCSQSVTLRTVERDCEMLRRLGVLHLKYARDPGQPGRPRKMWRLNLKCSESLQHAAIAITSRFPTSNVGN